MHVRRLAVALAIAGLTAAAGCSPADYGRAAQEASPNAVDDGHPTTRAAPSTALTALASRPTGSAAIPASLQFTATTLDGERFDATTLAGRPTVLWFWAPWCSTCAAEAAHVNTLAARTAGRVNVLGVAGLDEPAAMREFASLTKISGFPQLADGQGSIWRHFEITAQATYVLLDAAGIVQHSGYLSNEDLTARVNEMAG